MSWTWLQALSKGDWRRAYETLEGLPSWKLIPDHEQILKMLRQKLQEEGLRTYLLAYGIFYKSLSHAQLAAMFELPEKRVSFPSYRMCENIWVQTSGSCKRCTACLWLNECIEVQRPAFRNERQVLGLMQFAAGQICAWFLGATT